MESPQCIFADPHMLNTIHPDIKDMYGNTTVMNTFIRFVLLNDWIKENFKHHDVDLNVSENFSKLRSILENHDELYPDQSSLISDFKSFVFENSDYDVIKCIQTCLSMEKEFFSCKKFLPKVIMYNAQQNIRGLLQEINEKLLFAEAKNIEEEIKCNPDHIISLSIQLFKLRKGFIDTLENVINKLELYSNEILDEVDRFKKNHYLKKMNIYVHPLDTSCFDEISKILLGILFKLDDIIHELISSLRSIPITETGKSDEMLNRVDQILKNKFPNILRKCIQRLTFFEINDDVSYNVIIISDRKRRIYQLGGLSFKIFGCSDLMKNCVLESVELMSEDSRCSPLDLEDDKITSEKNYCFDNIHVFRSRFSIKERKKGKYQIALKIKFSFVHSSKAFYVFSDSLFFDTDRKHEWYFVGHTLWNVLFNATEIDMDSLLNNLIYPYIENVTEGHLNDQQRFYLSTLANRIGVFGQVKMMDFLQSPFCDKSKEKFDFSLWKYIYCSVNTLKRSSVNEDWKNQLIEGYISATDAKNRLNNCDSSEVMCIIRFRESKLEDYTENDQGARLCLSLSKVTKPIEISKNDLGNTKLNDYLRNLNLKSGDRNFKINAIYPNSRIDDDFQNEGYDGCYRQIMNCPTVDISNETTFTINDSLDIDQIMNCVTVDFSNDSTFTIEQILENNDVLNFEELNFEESFINDEQ